MLVVDESFFIKNTDARRTRALKRLREFCGRAFVLCGTPAPNAPQDLLEQFSFVDFGLTFGDMELPDDHAAATQAIQRAVDERGVFIRHLKSEVLPDLPGKRFTRLLVGLEPQQERLYSAALNGLILDLRSTADTLFGRHVASFLARRAALLQICSHPGGIAETYTEVPAKLLAIDQLLEQLIVDRGEKVVLWSFYRHSLAAAFERYQRFNPVRYDGTVSDIAVRREAVRRFQNDDDAPLFIGNPAAAGAGLTLHRARVAVYESLSNQGAHYLQSLDRIHRRGQQREVEYFVLLADRTIELVEYDRLTRKERAAQELLRDDFAPPLSRQAMLAELIAAQQLLHR
jgi:SNF2 family DNA or RNA helicase